jgi:hypothetical protein
MIMYRSTPTWDQLEADLEDPTFRREFVEETLARVRAAEELVRSYEERREAHIIRTEDELAAYARQLVAERSTAVLQPARDKVLFIRWTSDFSENLPNPLEMYSPVNRLKRGSTANLLNPKERGYELMKPWPMRILDGPPFQRTKRKLRSDQYLPDREHIVEFSPDQTQRLREWLNDPNGACLLGPRATFVSVEGGGTWVRTDPYRYIEPGRRDDDA